MGVTNNAAAKFIADIVKTREFKRMTGTLIPEALKSWAKNSELKRILSRRVLKILEKRFPQKESAPQESAKAISWSKTDLAGLVMDNIPHLLNSGAISANMLISSFEDLPLQEKERLLGNILKNLDFARQGEIITALSRIVQEIHKKNPCFFSDILIPALGEMISNIDFGELDDMLLSASEDIIKMAGALNTVLNEYPAKNAIMFGLFPAMANMFASVMANSMVNANKMAPDLVTDNMLSSVREIDAKEFARYLNERAEFLRKIHTGSALLGPPGQPALANEITRKITEVEKELDFELLEKAKALALEIKMARQNAQIELLRDNPELLTQRIGDFFPNYNTPIYGLLRKIELIDELDKTDLARAVAQGTKNLDVQELADALSLLCVALNRVNEKEPGFAGDIMSRFASAADSDEAGKTAQWLVKDTVKGLKPLAQAVMPQLVDGILYLFAPDDDEAPDDVKDALIRLRALLKGDD